MAQLTLNARGVVTRRLVQQAGRFPQLDLRPLDTSGLDERDAGLARAIEHAVMRRWGTLATVLDTCLDQDWMKLQPVVKAPLLTGAAQLLLLERIPDHAVISEAVAWSKRSSRPGASGLVNAVLRKVARLRGEIVEGQDDTRRDEIPWHDGRALRLQDEIFDDEHALRLAQVTSCSVALIDRWRFLFGREQATQLAYHSIMHPPIILHGVGADDADVEPHSSAGHVVYTGQPGSLAAFMQSHPDAIVQDPTAAAAIQSTRQMQPQTIVDMCAGRGTKTRQLAELHPDAHIIASDVDKARLEDLKRELTSHANLTVCPPSDLPQFAGMADLLLLDVPCSNSGVMARRPEARHRFDRDSLVQLRDLQRQIVADSLMLRSTNGAVLYCTCSVDPEENEEQVKWIGKWHNLQPATMWNRQPQGKPGGEPGEYHDGGFFCLLRPH